MVEDYEAYVIGFFVISVIVKTVCNWYVNNCILEEVGDKPMFGKEGESILFFMALIPWWNKHPRMKFGNGVAWVVFGISAAQILVGGILIYLYNVQ